MTLLLKVEFVTTTNKKKPTLKLQRSDEDILVNLSFQATLT